MIPSATTNGPVNAAGFVSFNGATVGGCNILTYNATGALTDIALGCHVMIFRMP